MGDLSWLVMSLYLITTRLELLEGRIENACDLRV